MAFKLEVEDGFFRGNQRLMIRHIYSRLSSSVAATIRPYLNTYNTATEFLEKLGKTCGIDIAKKRATNDLILAKQSDKETVDAYHTRLCTLWSLTGATEDEKIDKMQDSVSVGLALAVATYTFTSMEQLLETLRKAEYRRQEIKSSIPRNNDRRPNDAGITRERTRPTSSKRAALTTISHPEKNTSSAGNAAGRKPTATKPVDWVGPWFDPDPNPGKLSDEERVTINRQRRCNRCRGSGHFARDSVCPLYNGNTYLAQIRSIEEIPSDGESENSES